MRLRDVRFSIRGLMLVIAIAAVALAVILPLWNRPASIDPFDATEMIGPVKAGPDVRRPVQGPAQEPEDRVGQNSNVRTLHLPRRTHSAEAEPKSPGPAWPDVRPDTEP
jgi:hypothetical protein